MPWDSKSALVIPRLIACNRRRFHEQFRCTIAIYLVIASQHQNITMKLLFYWDRILPILAILAYFAKIFSTGVFGQVLVTLLLIGAIMSAVHHSELISEKIGEPFGTIILAVSITLIEVSLIISLMLAGGDNAVVLARDTVFSAVMILLTVIIGLCILAGTYKHFEQTFDMKSVNTALVSLVSILVLTLILPNFTTSGGIGGFSFPQLMFVSAACLIIYGVFIYVQTIRHRNFFISNNGASTNKKHEMSSQDLVMRLIFLVVSLVIVVLLAKTVSPTIEAMIIDAELPHSLLGVVIAVVILLPEGIAALRAALNDDIQTSLNLSFGSALAAIGLTIPSVAIVSVMFDIDVVLGLESKSMLLLGLTIFTVMLSLSKGRTNILYGVILIILFLTYVFTIVFP